MVDFSIPECTCFLCHVPYGSTFGRPSFLSFFLSGQNPTLLVQKFFVATSFFIAPCSGSLRYRSFALWEVILGFLLFLAGSLVLEKDISALCFLCFFFGVFLWVVLILSLLCYTPRGSRLRSFTLVLLPSSDLDLFSFFFLHRFWGSSFYGFWASSLLGLSPLFFNFIFYGPLCYSFGPGCCDFLDLNRVLSKSQNKLKWQKKSEIM